MSATARVINNYPVDDLLEESCGLLHDAPPSRGPYVAVTISGTEFPALVDSGSDVSCMSSEIFAQVQSLLPSLVVFPVQGVKVHGAFKTRALKVSHQLAVPFNLCNFAANFEFLVIPGLDVPLILGIDFIRAYDASLSAEDGVITLKIKTELEHFSIRETVWQHSPAVSSQSIRLACMRTSAYAPPSEDDESAVFSTVLASISLPEHQKKIFGELLVKYASVFSDRPGRTHVYEHEIALTDPTPFSVPQYPIPLAHRKAVFAEIESMERQGIISRASTPYSSPLVTAVKKNGAVRVCLDARRLNSVMLPDTELPRPIDDILLTLGPIRFVSSIDLTAGYWQVPLKKEHRQYTGFRVGTRSYVFNVLPFGISTAVSSFTRCMDLVLSPTCSGFTHCYVDDILVVSETFEEHLEHLNLVFNALKRAGFTMRLPKCSFFRESVNFLGYKLDRDGLRPDPDRIQGLLDFPVPKNIKSVQAFLGLANFDRVFTPNFSEVVEPLTQLLRKTSAWSWSDEQQRAFEQTKAMLAKETLLWHPDPTLPFVVQCDASDVGVGAVLYQQVGGKRRVVAYYSRLLLDRERRYTVSEKEFLAIVAALKKWRILLLGRRFEVLTDHRALVSYLRFCRLLSPRISRWVLALQEFDFSLEYVAGPTNIVADALSRCPPRFAPPQDASFRINNTRIHSNLKHLKKRLEQEQRTDAKFASTYRAVEDGEPKLGFVLHDGLLFRLEDIDSPALLCLPNSMVDEIISFLHTGIGHFGAYKTWCALRQECYFPGLFRRVKAVLRRCEICQFAKSAKLPQPQFEAIIPSAPNDLVAVDFYGPLPRSVGGVQYIFVLLDVFSKYVKLYPLKRATTKAIVNRLTKDYIPSVGKPQRILCDHGTQFIAKAWKSCLSENNINLLFTSVRHPSSNPSERVMREVNRLFRTYRSTDHKGWSRDVPQFEHFLNQVVHESTGFAPCSLHFGLKPQPLINLYNCPSGDCTSQHDNHVKLYLAHQALTRSAVRRQLKKAPDLHESFFEEGDLVLLRANPVPGDPLTQTKKFLSLFEGPYLIRKRLATKTFILECANTHALRGQFHASHLRRFYPSSSVEITASKN